MCLKGYFRGNKRLPQEFPEFPDNTIRVVLPGLGTPARPGPARPSREHPGASRTLSPPPRRRGRHDSHMGGARQPSCWAGAGEPRGTGPHRPGRVRGRAWPRGSTPSRYADARRTRETREPLCTPQGEHSSPGASAEGRSSWVGLQEKGIESNPPPSAALEWQLASNKSGNVKARACHSWGTRESTLAAENARS